MLWCQFQVNNVSQIRQKRPVSKTFFMSRPHGHHHPIAVQDKSDMAATAVCETKAD